MLYNLHAQTWTTIHPDRWGGPPTVVSAGALLRFVAMAVAAWMTLAIVGYVLSLTLGLTRAAAGFSRATLPSLRRLADRALVTTVIVGTVGSSPVAAAPPPIPAPVVVTQTIESPPDRAVPVVTKPQADSKYAVIQGDSFWKIAVAKAPDTDITSYWLLMIELNMETISSGNPNLIFPGEVLQLPTVVRPRSNR